MGKITWIKPSGDEFVTNDLDATVEYLEKLGFKRKERKKPGPKPKVKTDDHRD